MATQHTLFHEALMRAWAEGWMAHYGGALTDDAKHEAATRLAKQFPCEAAAPDLLEALSKLEPLADKALGALNGRNIEQDLAIALAAAIADSCHALKRAAIDKATKA